MIPCVQKACDPEEQKAAIDATETTCKAAGVDVEVPAMPGQESSAAPSSTAAPSTVIMTSTEEASVTVTETPAESSVSGYPTPSGNGTVPTASPTVSEFPGSAARATQAAGLLAAAGIALFAL